MRRRLAKSTQDDYERELEEQYRERYIPEREIHADSITALREPTEKEFAENSSHTYTGPRVFVFSFLWTEFSAYERTHGKGEHLLRYVYVARREMLEHHLLRHGDTRILMPSYLASDDEARKELETLWQALEDDRAAFEGTYAGEYPKRPKHSA